MAAVEVIGMVAAVFTTGAFIPQILKIRKQGGEDLSYSMLSFYLAGVSLWLGYGLLLHAPAVIWANAAAVLLVSTSVVMKAAWSGRDRRSRARRPRIAVDMDEVIADCFGKHLALFNQATGAKVTAGDVARDGLDEAIPAEHLAVFERLPHEDGFFNDLEVMPGSRHALEMLVRDFDVFVVSAAMEVPLSFDAKFKWMRRHFPFIAPSRLVFCGDKGIVDADYMIDDNSRHFAEFKGKGILFTAPHNRREKALLRADSWEDVLTILARDRALTSCTCEDNGMKAERTVYAGHKKHELDTAAGEI